MLAIQLEEGRRRDTEYVQTVFFFTDTYLHTAQASAIDIINLIGGNE